MIIPVSTFFVQNLHGLLNEEWQTEPKFAQGTVFMLAANDIFSLTLFPISLFDIRFRFRLYFDFLYAYLYCAASSLALQPFKSSIGSPHERLPFYSLQCSCPSFYTHIPQSNSTSSFHLNLGLRFFSLLYGLPVTSLQPLYHTFLRHA